MNFKKNKSSLKITLKLVIFLAVVVLGLGVNYIFADWQGPLGDPPTGSIDVPVNTGPNEQTKTGILRSGGLHSLSSLRVDGRVGINNLNYAAIQLGDDEAGKGMHITKTDDTGGNSLIFWAGKLGFGTKLMTLLQDGNLVLEKQIKIKGGIPGAGKVLTSSDATGLATWQTPSGSGGLPSGSASQTLRHNGTSWIANSLIYNNGTNVGIGLTNPLTKLHVNGDINVSSAVGVYKWGNIAGLNSTTCTSGQALTGINIRGGIVTGGTCSDVSGGGGGLSGSGTLNYIPRWTGASSLGNSIMSQSGSTLNITGNLGLNVSEGTSLINRTAGALSIRAQSTGATPGSIDFRTDGTIRMTIHEPNSIYNYLDGTVDIAKLRVQGAGAAGKILSSVNSQGLAQWSTLSSMAVTSITAGPGIQTSGSTGNVTVSVAQGAWCGNQLARATGQWGGFGKGEPMDGYPGQTRLCQGHEPAVSCPQGYTAFDYNSFNFDWAQMWTCIKN